MKESELIKMRKEVESLASVVTYALNELSVMKDTAIGTLELVKKMPDYELALEALKQALLDSQVKEAKNEPVKLEFSEPKPKRTKKKLE